MARRSEETKAALICTIALLRLLDTEVADFRRGSCSGCRKQAFTLTENCRVVGEMGIFHQQCQFKYGRCCYTHSRYEDSTRTPHVPIIDNCNPSRTMLRTKHPEEGSVGGKV